ncbi:hypothetical protein HPB49_008291 [Dermacentor silvarum]|uniref:Uncharacterized protein n=1 Tax=Dermacentor silvarum TaxID=543639 RepID=A0ACB8DX70_DERSI|nr:hypothetical protein HPB49_008291 [Dermacentor silvarum]
MERLGFEPSECSKQTGNIPDKLGIDLKLHRWPRTCIRYFTKADAQIYSGGLQVRFEGRCDVLFTDAAEYDSRAAHTAVGVRESGDPVLCGTVKNTSTTEEEEVAIALLTQNSIRVIVSDSKAAIKNYDIGRISVTAAEILRKCPESKISLIRSPAHQVGDEKAHATAGGLTFQSIAADSPPPREEPLPTGDDLRTSQQITFHYKLR